MPMDPYRSSKAEMHASVLCNPACRPAVGACRNCRNNRRLGLLIACSSDPAGCGMGEAYRIFAVPAYALIGMIAFGISAPGQGRERTVRITMKVLMLVPIFLIAFGLAAEPGRLDRRALTFWKLCNFAAIPVLGCRCHTMVRGSRFSAPAGAGARLCMKPRTALPWISLLLIVVAAISPLGREILGKRLRASNCRAASRNS